MIINLSTVALFIWPGYTDLRKAINGLAVLVEEEMGEDPFSASLFLFCNRYRKILKVIYWDRNGFCLWQKRLEKDRFPWPESDEAARRISGGELRMLLDGIDCWKAHKPILCQSVK